MPLIWICVFLGRQIQALHDGYLVDAMSVVLCRRVERNEPYPCFRIVSIVNRSKGEEQTLANPGSLHPGFRFQWVVAICHLHHFDCRALEHNHGRCRPSLIHCSIAAKNCHVRIVDFVEWPYLENPSHAWIEGE